MTSGFVLSSCERTCLSAGTVPGAKSGIVTTDCPSTRAVDGSAGVQLERHAGLRSALERFDLALEDVDEGLVEHACGLERLSQLPQRPVDLGDLGGQVLEAAGEQSARSPADVLGNLHLCEPHVCGEGDEVLERAVVEIETEPEQAPLA